MAAVGARIEQRVAEVASEAEAAGFVNGLLVGAGVLCAGYLVYYLYFASGSSAAPSSLAIGKAVEEGVKHVSKKHVHKVIKQAAKLASAQSS